MVTAQTTSLWDYTNALSHTTYLLMWLAECIKQAGNWFTFVAAYAVITELAAGHAAMHTALFLICRRAPYLLLFPLTGLAADRLNRGALLVVVCLLQGAVSFSLPLVRFYGRIELLYPLVLLQYSAQAFYDPARMASVPLVVPPKYLCVAGSLDMFGLALMALAGASLAGRTAAVYGTDTCFRVEGVCFGFAATLLLRLAWHISARKGAPEEANGGRHAKDEGGGLRQPLLEEAAAEAAAVVVPVGEHEAPLLQAHELRNRDAGGSGLLSFLGALSFMARRPNWDVAVLVWAKATGAMAWGAADVLNGRFTTMISMHGLGDRDQTLGLILAGVGLGAVAGPLIANAITPGVARFWRISVATGFGLLLLGYTLMSLATSIWYVLPATVIRTAGSSTIWCHSVAIMQHRLDDSVRGRVLAVEFLLFTASEAGSTLFGGFALDGLGWSTCRLSATLAALAAALGAVWTVHAVAMWKDDQDARKRGFLADGPPPPAEGGRPQRAG